jgi:hypothetical protein
MAKMIRALNRDGETIYINADKIVSIKDVSNNENLPFDGKGRKYSSVYVEGFLSSLFIEDIARDVANNINYG